MPSTPAIAFTNFRPPDCPTIHLLAFPPALLPACRVPACLPARPPARPHAPTRMHARTHASQMRCSQYLLPLARELTWRQRPHGTRAGPAPFHQPHFWLRPERELFCNEAGRCRG